MSDRCYRCDRSLGLVPDDEIRNARESLGFGGGSNDRLRSFCGVRCRALWRGSDPVLDETDQSRIDAWTADGLAGSLADRITYAID